MHENKTRITLVEFDDSVSCIGEFFADKAKLTCGVKTAKNNINKQKGKSKEKLKPWFDRECKHARKTYRRLKRIYKNRMNPQSRDEMKHAEKTYKTQLNKPINKHKRELRKKFKNLS